MLNKRPFHVALFLGVFFAISAISGFFLTWTSGQGELPSWVLALIPAIFSGIPAWLFFMAFFKRKSTGIKSLQAGGYYLLLFMILFPVTVIVPSGFTPVLMFVLGSTGIWLLFSIKAHFESLQDSSFPSPHNRSRL